MMDKSSVLDLVGEIYEAAYRPEHWVSVIQQLCAELNAKSAGIFCEDYVEKRRTLLAAHGLPALSSYSYRLGLGRYDHAYRVMLEKAEGASSTIIDHQKVKEDHPMYYRLLLKPNDVGYVAGLNIFKNAEWHVGLGIHRSFEANPFSEEDLHLIQLLHPHFQRALKIQRAFQAIKSHNQSMKAALSHLAMGVALVKKDLTIVFLNESAKTILDYHPALGVKDGQLKAWKNEHQLELSEAIEHSIQSESNETKYNARAISLHHSEALAPLSLICGEKSEAPGEVSLVSMQDVALLFISDPETNIRVSADVLKQLYELTPAETKLAIGLLNGLNLGEIAELNGNSVTTLRVQLRSIFDKTGVKRQQELVRLLVMLSVNRSD